MSWIKAKYGACTVKEAAQGKAAISVSASYQQLHPIWSVICKLRVLHKVCLHAWGLVHGKNLTNVENLLLFLGVNYDKEGYEKGKEGSASKGVAIVGQKHGLF
jgi:hypothetical protein